MAESLGSSELRECPIRRWCETNNLMNSYNKFVELGFAASIEHLQLLISYTRGLDENVISQKFGITFADAFILKCATDVTSSNNKGEEAAASTGDPTNAAGGGQFLNVSTIDQLVDGLCSAPIPSEGQCSEGADQGYYITITKQPLPQRYRYSSEREQSNELEFRNAKLSGRGYSRKEADIEIQVNKGGCDYGGGIQVTGYLVTDEGTCPHPHSLAGPHCDDGYYRDQQCGPCVRIPHLQIIRSKYNQLNAQLQIWQQHGLDPDNKLTDLLTPPRRSNKDAFDLDVVRLCVRLNILSPDGISIECLSVISRPIADSSKMSRPIDLEELTSCGAEVERPSETVLLGHHFHKDDAPLFYEKDGNGTTVWQAKGDVIKSFAPNALKVRTPVYDGPSKSSTITAQVKIQRLEKMPNDKTKVIAESRSLNFQYKQDEYGISAKRQKVVKVPKGYMETRITYCMETEERLRDIIYGTYCIKQTTTDFEALQTTGSAAIYHLSPTQYVSYNASNGQLSSSKQDVIDKLKHKLAGQPGMPGPSQTDGASYKTDITEAGLGFHGTAQPLTNWPPSCLPNLTPQCDRVRYQAHQSNPAQGRQDGNLATGEYPQSNGGQDRNLTTEAFQLENFVHEGFDSNPSYGELPDGMCISEQLSVNSGVSVIGTPTDQSQSKLCGEDVFMGPPHAVS